MLPSIQIGLNNTGRFLSVSLFYFYILEDYFDSSHPLLLTSFMTSEKLIDMRQSIVLTYASKKDKGLVLVPNGVDDIGDTASHSRSINSTMETVADRLSLNGVADTGDKKNQS